MSDLRAYEKEELYNGCWTELYPFIDFNYTVGSNITFHCLDPVNLTGTVAVSVQYTSAIHPTVRASSSRKRKPNPNSTNYETSRVGSAPWRRAVWLSAVHSLLL